MSPFSDVAMVQDQMQVGAAQVDDTQLRERAGDRNETGDRVGALKRPRDQDSQDDHAEGVTVTASTSMAVAAVDSTVDIDQPQSRERDAADADPPTAEDAALKRPRDQDSQE
jgi:hypothetical protein